VAEALSEPEASVAGPEDSGPDNSESEDKPKRARKKAAKKADTTKGKTSGKKAAAKKGATAKKQAPKAADAANENPKEDATPSSARAPISSAPQDVIEVGASNPETRKRGWWSRD